MKESKIVMGTNMKKFKVKGFSLIELMIVLVILGLLGSLVAPKLISKSDSSKVKVAVAQMRMFESAIDTYRLDVGSVPQSLQELRKSSQRNWDGPYLPKDIPLDPWGNQYSYTTPGENGGLYTVKSFGADGKPGGTDNNLDIVHK